MTADSILAAFDFYRRVAPESRAQLAASATVVSLRRGATFYREGDLCQEFALVGRGDIRVFKDAAGREITLYHVRAGEPCLLNIVSVFLGRPAAATAVVESETEVILVPANVVRRWLSVHESVRTFVFESMSLRLNDVMALAVEVSIRRLDVRLASLLLKLADVNRTVRLTHDELASELGTAREVVSRLLKELERSGALHLGRAQVTIVDPSRLASVTAAGR